MAIICRKISKVVIATKVHHGELNFSSLEATTESYFLDCTQLFV